MAFGLICLIYVVALAILFAELFVPGSFLGFIGTGLLIASIVLAFYYHSPAYGISLVFITSIVVPAMIIWWLRRITLSSSQNVEDGFVSGDESLESLVGKQGISITLLRPSGMAKIENRRVDVTAENVLIPANTPIQVTKVDSNRVIVIQIGEPIEED